MTDVEAQDEEVGPSLEPPSDPAGSPSPGKAKSKGQASGDAAARTGDPGRSEKTQKEPPDPVIGIGLVVLGVLIMGIGGAATLHYVFNAGTAITIVGALVFVISVAMSSLGERKLRPQ